jgi:hypothetical protein
MNGRRALRALLWMVGAVSVVWACTWLVGASPAQRALADLDQHRLDAFFSRTARGQSLPRIEAFVVDHGVALPAVWYYEGRSHTSAGAVSDHVHKSLVLWYGVGATVAWQDKEWFPGGAARMRSLAETGY